MSNITELQHAIALFEAEMERWSKTNGIEEYYIVFFKNGGDCFEITAQLVRKNSSDIVKFFVKGERVYDESECLC